jgi:hypothetical protein
LINDLAIYYLKNELTTKVYSTLDSFSVRLIGKLQDGTVFMNKGHNGTEVYEIMTSQGGVITSHHYVRLRPNIYYLLLYHELTLPVPFCQIKLLMDLMKL